MKRLESHPMTWIPKWHTSASMRAGRDHEAPSSGRTKNRPEGHRALLFALLAGLAGSYPLHAQAGPNTLRGQLLYVPVYSEIAYGDRRHTLNLSATVTIRNTDRKRPIRITRVDYHNADGTLNRPFQTDARTLNPLAALEYVVSGSDRSAGTASSFLISWESADAVSPPLVSAVMIGAASTNGISFTAAPQVLEERP